MHPLEVGQRDRSRTELYSRDELVDQGALTDTGVPTEEGDLPLEVIDQVAHTLARGR